ncbi:HpcH/HpaI aldolase/citrate lyase family protein [Agromyces archimandritae]|uniref:HpcH/HpaI aldolase/citrate lyase family protein n=1 Tax=Agromyces archimandritae TaxID=2781962 RepID=A0A975FNR1_9MICO|nr:aldolase/citrate lyase family protein [Agromyces archimandritae]QTX05042.1 HpcH/HpaI aldolase/citrate lyase family protein [Agromyces archimandritae]
MTHPDFPFGPALLFCPADRPERYAKALERADAVIIDLEDAVDAAARPAARDALIATPVDPARVIVRVNPAGSPDFAADLAAVARTRYRTVMLAKCDGTADLVELVELTVIALCETAAGVLAAPAIAELPNVAALMWGAEDLVASLGGSSSRGPDGGYREVARHARSRVLLAAGAHGIAAIDAVHLAIDDADGLRAESEDAAAVGFAATACIHPSQAAIVREAYRPDAAELDAARALLAAAAEHGTGAFAFEGRMVDAPVLRHAEALVRRAGR